MLDCIFEKYDRVIVLDTETTGINCKTEQIIELAAVALDSDGVRREMDDLIQLSDGKRLSQEITELTHITEQMLHTQGVPKRLAAEHFCELLQGGKALVCAFNAQFDFTFLFFFLQRLGMADALKGIEMLDVLTVYKDRKPYPHRLFNAISAYAVEAQNTHRAIDDAIAAMLVLEAMREEKDDIMHYVNLFGFNPKYGVSGPRIGSIHYAPQQYDPQYPLYELYQPV